MTHPEQVSEISRTRCSVFIAMSLDGFIADREGRVDFLDRAALEGEDYGYAEFEASIDALVIGRKTYETALGFDRWPYADRRCIVLTSNPHAAAVHNEEFFSGNVEDLAKELADSGLGRVYVDGGATIRAFLRAGMIDDLTITLVPVLLGDGVPLFGEDAAEDLQLESARSFESGVVQVTYRVSRHRAATELD